VGVTLIKKDFKLPKFFPPTVLEGPAGFGMFYRYKLLRGISVLKINGKYYKLRVPSTDQVESASEYYTGGHEYEVSSSTKTALLNAGIGLTESNFEG
jgi:hypothetical protein